MTHDVSDKENHRQRTIELKLLKPNSLDPGPKSPLGPWKPLGL